MTTVAVALLEREGKVLICRRRSDQTHGGKWEFPGGKVEPGETPGQALVRELGEELGVLAEAFEEVCRYEYTYPGKPAICLAFFRVDRYAGAPQAGQFADLRWESCESLAAYDFLEGDARIVRELSEGLHLATTVSLASHRPPRAVC